MARRALVGPFAAIGAGVSVLATAGVVSSQVALAAALVSAGLAASIGAAVGSLRGSFARAAVGCVAACVATGLLYGVIAWLVLRSRDDVPELVKVLVGGVPPLVVIPLCIPLLLVTRAAWSTTAREGTPVHAAEMRSRWRIVAGSLAVVALWRPPLEGVAVVAWPPTHVAVVATILAVLLAIAEHDARRSILDARERDGFSSVDAIPTGAQVIDHGVGDALFAGHVGEHGYREAGGTVVVRGDAARARALVGAKLRASVGWALVALAVVAWHAVFVGFY